MEKRGSKIGLFNSARKHQWAPRLEERDWGSVPAKDSPPRSPNPNSRKDWAITVRRWAFVCASPGRSRREQLWPWGFPQEPALRMGGSRRPGRRQERGPALKPGHQFRWSLAGDGLAGFPVRAECTWYRTFGRRRP